MAETAPEETTNKTVGFFIQYFEKQLDFFNAQIAYLHQKQKQEKSERSSQAQQQLSRVDRVDYRAPEHKARLQAAIDEVTAQLQEDSGAIHRLVTDVAKKHNLPYNTLRDNYLRSKGTTKMNKTTVMMTFLTSYPFFNLSSLITKKGLNGEIESEKLPQVVILYQSSFLLLPCM